MNFEIRNFEKNDKNEIISMMREFYSSNAVFTNGSDEIFEKDFINCINKNPYLEGYIFYNQEEILGYAMLAKSFSTEFAKPCIWFEDLYVKPNYRGKGIITNFIKLIKAKYINHIFKLEVEDENQNALIAYKKNNFKKLPYSVMYIEN